ncbi:MAG: D-alanyl-D-alanine carboxypeptidase, partial [Glaciimonas sp.]|nr:D-alanyl-D-alanine carboxypeptidase [Glaciimonas sp.]
MLVELEANMGKSAVVIFFSLFIAFATTSASAKEGKANKAAVSKSSKTIKNTTSSAKSAKIQPIAKAKNAKTVVASRQSSKASRSSKVVAAEPRGKVNKAAFTNNRRKASVQRATYSPPPTVVPRLSAGEMAGLYLTLVPLELKSSVALVLDQYSGQVLFEKNAQIALPIASLTKLMTSMVV